MRTITFLIIVIGFIGIGTSGVVIGADPLNNEAGILDGMVFVGHVGPKGSEANGEDEVVFQDGQFLSTSCSKYGFGSAPYTAFREGNSINFTAVTHSPKMDKYIGMGRLLVKR